MSHNANTISGHWSQSVVSFVPLQPTSIAVISVVASKLHDIDNGLRAGKNMQFAGYTVMTVSYRVAC